MNNYSNYLFSLFSALFILAGCGSKVVAIVGNQNIYLNEISMSEKSVLLHEITAHKDQLNNGKLEITDKEFTDHLILKEVKQKEEMNSLAYRIHQEVMGQLCERYKLTYITHEVSTPLKNKLQPKSKTTRAKSSYKDIHRRTLDSEKSFIITALKVRDDKSDIREVYKGDANRKLKYSTWLIKYYFYGPTRKELEKSLDWVIKEESKDNSKEFKDFGDLMINGITTADEMGFNLLKFIDQEISKDDIELQECMSKSKNIPAETKGCRTEARKRYWDKKYKEIGIKIVIPEYKDAEKLFIDNYNLDDPSDSCLIHLKYIQGKWIENSPEL